MVFLSGMDKANSIRQLPLNILAKAFYVFLLVALILFTLFFIEIIPLSWPLGWILGSVIGSINYGLIIVQANRLTLGVQNKVKAGASPIYMVSRLGLFAIGLLASVFIRLDNVELFNIFTIFVSYLVISSIIFITGANFRTMRR
jgi:hypothetical protein